MGPHRSISNQEHEDLIEKAVHVEYLKKHEVPKMESQTFKATHKKLIKVPTVQEKTVPVYKKYIDKAVHKHVVQGTKITPIIKTKQVTYTEIEQKVETIDHGTTEMMKRVSEPVECIIKTHVPVTRMVRKAYVEYVPVKTEKKIEVPNDRIVEKRGVRVDKHIGFKVLELEEDHHYEMRAQYKANGETRARHCGKELHGKLSKGRSVWHGHDDSIIHDTRQNVSAGSRRSRSEGSRSRSGNLNYNPPSR